jgi:hypothetical protein
VPARRAGPEQTSANACKRPTFAACQQALETQALAARDSLRAWGRLSFRIVCR